MTYAELVKYFSDKKIVYTDNMTMRVTLGSGEVISMEALYGSRS